MNPFAWIFSVFSGNKNRPDPSSIYSLDHAILNIALPPQSMWMNLGYWKDATTLPAACAALLDQVLITANLLDAPTSIPTQPSPPSLHPSNRRLHLLDVGIGCGDQSIHLLNLTRRVPVVHHNPALTHDNETSHQPLFDTYTGLTIVPTQAEYARRRLDQHQRQNQQRTVPNAKIYCADAANPSTWSNELSHRCTCTSTIKKRAEPPLSPPAAGNADSLNTQDENWLLALDTLYHFSPSRQPLLHYASTTLHASLMAFDLTLSNTATVWDRFVLRIVCWLSGTPYSNLLTRDEYEALLVRCGYPIEYIQMRDISEDVFAGIAGFLRRREEELKGWGLSLGKYKGAKVIFDRWARKKVVRGVIVVARCK